MNLRFTKMHGAGNDFIVLDATQAPLDLSREQIARLGDRHFGVGADQLLVVERSTQPGIDFRYRIFNGASGDEVEQCGNGARCFVRYVLDKGLTERQTIRVETINSVLELRAQADGRVTVDMNAPVFDLERVPFDNAGLPPRAADAFEPWPIVVEVNETDRREVAVAVLSMGNPHAVQVVADVDTAPVALLGPLIERHPRFPRQVNAGFMQIVDRGHIRLRVFERDAGETLSCGSGACAAVVAGIRLGLLDATVDVDTRGGRLTIAWAGERQMGDEVNQPDNPNGSRWAPVLMTGPAVTVYEGEITL